MQVGLIISKLTLSHASSNAFLTIYLGRTKCGSLFPISYSYLLIVFLRAGGSLVLRPFLYAPLGVQKGSGYETSKTLENHPCVE